MRLRTGVAMLAFCVAGTGFSEVRETPDTDVPQIYRPILQNSNRRRNAPFVVLASHYRLCFVPPRTWGVKYDQEKHATLLLHPGLEAGISISIGKEPITESAPPLSERLHESIRQRYPDAELGGEFKVYAAGKEGWAVEFERRIERQGVRTSFRRAMFEFDEGTVELEMVAASSRFANYDHTYGGLLNSLQVDFGVNVGSLPLPSYAAGAGRSPD
jgi:hypothetical protein